jgi:hypothetical protein
VRAVVRYRHRDARGPWPLHNRWLVRLELEPWHDVERGHVPAPAVWTVRDRGRRVVFATSDAEHARLVADARARNRPDPIIDGDAA